MAGEELTVKRSLRVGDGAADLHAEVGIDDLVNAARLAELLAVAVEAGEDRADLCVMTNADDGPAAACDERSAI